MVSNNAVQGEHFFNGTMTLLSERHDYFEELTAISRGLGVATSMKTDEKPISTPKETWLLHVASLGETRLLGMLRVSERLAYLGCCESRRDSPTWDVVSLGETRLLGML
ncbi:hypothetical protein Q31b_46380 [Novipirellula aureliae]|uniref:Uncharacterized protein n=1 Tax=Novipirellula aureliae TaxID=2527966 RepID=A0A5C6DSX5_9BACT|nr:hypothetical protein [Novipirellula aureliae]TWU37849.1 hypothetical protein Q31b_46380 [Novipirellula aureliae]